MFFGRADILFKWKKSLIESAAGDNLVTEIAVNQKEDPAPAISCAPDYNQSR